MDFVTFSITGTKSVGPDNPTLAKHLRYASRTPVGRFYKIISIEQPKSNIEIISNQIYEGFTVRSITIQIVIFDIEIVANFATFGVSSSKSVNRKSFIPVIVFDYGNY